VYRGMDLNRQMDHQPDRLALSDGMYRSLMPTR
jgi:hypothetical protein